ncbi:MAG: GerMN domain-containing protein [Nocardioidaceae bacterium]|nr:GerMN domain-containing protein [Nocardioidaceae bacterium]
MSTDDRDLTALLHETAEQITPHGTLEEIRSRTGNPPARRWALPALAAAAALALVVGGIGWALRDHEKGGGTTTPATRTETAELTIYYAGPSVSFDGKASASHALFAERHELTSDDLPRTAVQDAISGRPADPDYLSLWPQGVTVDKVAYDAAGKGLVTVELSGPLQGIAEERTRDQMLASRAVVRTALDAVDAGPDAGVQFSYNGVLDAGVVQYRGDGTVDLAKVQITSLTNGQTVPAGPLTVKGMAATFEANVVWEVLVGGDAVVKQDHTTAAECCTLAPYEFTVDLEPGTYTIVAHDTDESGEGRPVNQDTKEIIVE